MAGITTHVLDIANGRPAQGIKVKLEILRRDWEEIGYGVTDNDGRLRTLTTGMALERATYRLIFATSGFFPEVAITFRVDNPEENFHVPLLFSPYGYSTYRGS